VVEFVQEAVIVVVVDSETDYNPSLALMAWVVVEWGWD